MRKLLLLVLAGLLIAGAAVSQTKSKKRIIQPPDFPTGRPFSPGVLVDGTLYVAGQVGRDLKTNQMPESFEGQTRQTLDNVGKILKAGGMDFPDVVNVNVYLTDIGKFDEMNKIYVEYFKTDRPARATVQVAKLGGTAQIEISAVAHK